MKVISLNLNGIRSAVRKGLIKWIEKQHADLICFQETKAQIEQLTTIMSSFQDWHTSFSDAEKKGYSGVAIFSKKRPKLISKSFGFREADREGRFIQFDFERLSIVSVYFPSGSSGMERQDMKYRFMEEFEKWLNSKGKDLKKFIICGDLNIAHNEIDLKNWKGNRKNSDFYQKNVIGSAKYSKNIIFLMLTGRYIQIRRSIHGGLIGVRLGIIT